MKHVRFMAVFAIIAACMGCVNPKSVRDFSGEAARLSACVELTERFRDTYRREQPYLSGQAAAMAKANDQRRQAACQDLLKVHRKVSRYLRTLAVLAGDKTFDLQEDLDALANGVKAHPGFGLEGKEVDAYSKLAGVIAKWSTSVHREKLLREMLQNGDPPLQTLLAGMASFASLCRKTNENERASVIGMLEAEISFVDAPQDRLLATLAKAHLQSKILEYQLADAMYAEAEKGIQKIQAGHRALLENAGRLSSSEARAMIDQFTKDIRGIRQSLQTLHAW